MNSARANSGSFLESSDVVDRFTIPRSLFFSKADLYKGRVARVFSMQSNDIEGLINRIAMGDRAAFVALYRATSPKLMGVCLRILKNRGDAEEALQEIYIKIWQRAKTFATGHSGPIAWLATIARNHAIDTIRARKPASDNLDAVYDLADDMTPNPEQRMGTVDEGRRIDRCMAELDPAHARAVRRAYVEGLSYLELADDLKIPLNTVRTWLRRSLLKLRECIQR
jgi:RNA polymerase sigma-70 factor (ECF subfamily)